MRGRAFRHVADRVDAGGAGVEGAVPQLLPGPRAARGVLGAAEVSPHAVVDDDLRAAGSADGGRGGGTRGALETARAEPPGARARARGHRPRSAAAAERA